MRPATLLHAAQEVEHAVEVGLIEGLVSRIKAEYGKDMSVIGTGGLAALFSDCTDAIDQVDEDLTLHGLVLIHRLNRRADAVHGA